MTTSSPKSPRIDVSSDSANPGYPPSSFRPPRVPSPGSPRSVIEPSVRASTPGASTRRASSMNAGSVSVAGPLARGPARAASTVASAPVTRPAPARTRRAADGRRSGRDERTLGMQEMTERPRPGDPSTLACGEDDGRQEARAPTGEPPAELAVDAQPCRVRWRRRRRSRARPAPCAGQCTRSRATRRAA